MVIDESKLMGQQVQYLDHLSMPQIGTIIDWRPHKEASDVMLLAVICKEEAYNEQEYTYQDKLTGEVRTVLIDRLVRSDECKLIEE